MLHHNSITYSYFTHIKVYIFYSQHVFKALKLKLISGHLQTYVNIYTI